MFRKKFGRSLSEQHSYNENVRKVSRDASFQESTDKRQESITTFEELLQCGLCFQRLLEPKMLPCQHTFCLGCIQMHFTRVVERTVNKGEVSLPSYKLPCPTCKKCIIVGKKLENLQKLPRNVHIDSLLMITGDSANSPIPSPIISSPSVKCSKCDTVYELPGKTCQHCRQLFCLICYTGHVSTLKSNLDSLIDNLQEAEIRLKHRLEDFNNHCKKVNENIVHETEIKVSKLKEKEIGAVAKLNDIKENELNVASELKNRIHSISHEMGQLNYDHISNADEKVNTFMNLHKTTSKILEEISRWGEFKILFDSNSYKLTENKYVNLSQTNGEDVQLVNSPMPFNPFDSVENMSMYYLEKSLKPKLIWKKCPRPGGVGIPPWAPNLLYITTTDRKVVLIMNIVENKVVGKLSSSEMLYPQSIAFCSKRKEIYVSDKWKHCIHVFNEDDDYLRTLCSLGGGASELRNPSGIVVNDNDEIIICDTGNDRILILNPEKGQQIGILGMVGKRTILQEPTDVTLYNENIYVADSGNHSIKVFLRSGEKVLEFGNLGNTREQFKLPEVVACDPMGFIIVGDSGNGRIQVFSPNGEFIKAFGKREKKEFGWISGLLITPQLDIITTDSKSQCLQIF